jgi:hypothetical protein
MRQLAQARPSSTTAESLFSNPINSQYVLSVVNICNVSATAAALSLFHDVDGATYDEGTALLWAYTLAPGEVLQYEANLSGDLAAGNVGIKTSVANALNFTAYGTIIGERR